MKKRAIIFIISYVSIISGIAAVQGLFADAIGKKILFDFSEIIPQSVHELKGLCEKKADVSPSEKEEQRPIFNTGKNRERLGRFFKKLNDLESGRRDTVRIMHYGDSLIWGDNFSSVMKKRFQADFGDGGRGLVPAIHCSSTSLKDHVNLSNPGQFKLFSLGHKFFVNNVLRLMPDIDPRLGFTAESCQPLFPGSVIKLETPPGFAGWTKIQVFIRSPQAPEPAEAQYQLNLQYNSRTETRTVNLKPDTGSIITFSVRPVNSVSIDFNGCQASLPYVDGIFLETGKGIVYSTMVRMGTHMSWLNTVSEKHFAGNMKAMNPDLIVFQYGNNEAYSIESIAPLTPELVKAQMREWLAKLKNTLPEADILIIGPPEWLRMIRGAPVYVKQTIEVIQKQKEAADELGFAFFDVYEFFGGKGQMIDLVRQGLALDDYMHLSGKGGTHLGDNMYTMIFNEYRRYLGKTSDLKKQDGMEIGKERGKPIQFNSKGYAYFMLIVSLFCALFFRKPRYRVVTLIIASCYFYMTWEVWPVLLLLSITIVDYSLGKLIYNARIRSSKGTLYLVFSIIYSLGVLFIFKYFDFLSGLAAAGAGLLGWNVSFPVLRIALPVGISFYTFKSLSYTIDIWRGRMEPEKSLVNYALFISFFPQLLAGPISRAREFLSNLDAKYRRFMQMNSFFPAMAKRYWSDAIFLILTGLLKKMAADWLGANLIDRVYASPGMFTSVETLAAIFGYAMQIYGDFAGYTDIASGSAMLLGYKLPVNFDRPYLSDSVTDFWRRWNITLGSWFRDYLYISLGGNRRRVYFNLFITLFLCGLWHGARVNYIIWGLYHGVMMIIERISGLDKLKNRNSFIKWLRIVITFCILNIGLIIFRSESMNNFMDILRSLTAMTLAVPNLSMAAIAVIFLFYLAHFTPLSLKAWFGRIWASLPTTAQGAASAFATVFLYNIATADITPFIYFRF